MYSVSDTREALATLVTVIDELLALRNTITVVDTTGLVTVRHGLPPLWLARLFKVKIASVSLTGLLEKRGVALVEPTRAALSKQPLPLPEETLPEITEAMESSSLSYFRDDKLPESLQRRLRSERIFQDARIFYWWLRTFLEKEKTLQTVVVPNGRVTSQRACILAAQYCQRDVLYYEIGRASNKAAYLGWHRIHDRVQNQNEALIWARENPSSKALEISHNWISGRKTPHSDVNQFAKTWGKVRPGSPTREKLDDREVATFFSSSADEFTALGPEWKLQEWEDQYEAFSSIATLLTRKGVECVLRVHPNLVNKSSRHFWSEIRKIRSFSKSHPSVSIIWPNQAVNSYQLVENSDYVVVARSTIGLEASALGKCVWTTTPTRYDNIADVRKIWKRDEVTDANFTIWEASPIGAAQYVAHLIQADLPFSEEVAKFTSWNSANPPWKIRALNFFIPQPLRHKLHIVKLELATQLQKRIPVFILRGF
jgi:hypothetical protein